MQKDTERELANNAKANMIHNMGQGRYERAGFFEKRWKKYRKLADAHDDNITQRSITGRW